jgi:hypothetical protein
MLDQTNMRRGSDAKDGNETISGCTFTVSEVDVDPQPQGGFPE